LKTFRCAISEVWTAPIPGAPPPVAMKSGAIGNLFLSREGWQTMSEDGYKIFGVDTDLALFKYPNAAAGPRILNRLAVRPSMIAVHGILHGSDRRIDIDLVGPDAAQAQDIAWTGAAEIEVKLTARGSYALHGHHETSVVRVWPTRILVQGAPEIDPTLSGEVDLLSCELAGLVQHIKFAHHGAPIILTLTQDGINAFHVVPGLADTPSPRPSSRPSPLAS
jgi:hypothetical protein